MTESAVASTPPAPPFAWERLPRPALVAARVVGGLSLSIPVVPIGIVSLALLDAGTVALLAAIVLLLAASLGAWLGGRRAHRVRYALMMDGLRIRRGLCWWREILIPRSRVQHLDLERGPIERHLGLTTLVIHTAGTRMNAVRLAGLEQVRARALRDALVDREGADDAV